MTNSFAIENPEIEVDFLNEVSICIFIKFECSDIFVYNHGLVGLQVNTHLSNNPKPKIFVENL